MILNGLNLYQEDVWRNASGAVRLIYHNLHCHRFQATTRERTITTSGYRITEVRNNCIPIDHRPPDTLIQSFLSVEHPEFHLLTYRRGSLSAWIWGRLIVVLTCADIALDLRILLPKLNTVHDCVHEVFHRVQDCIVTRGFTIGI